MGMCFQKNFRKGIRLCLGDDLGIFVETSPPAPFKGGAHTRTLYQQL